MIRYVRCVVAAAALVVFNQSTAIAQVEVRSRALQITLTGRVHSQFSTTSVAGERSSEFQIRRARLTAAVQISDWVDGSIQPDFGQGKISLKDAFLRLTLDPALRLSFGQFKRAFDIFELPSSTQILMIERTGNISGVDSCIGPGGVCSWSRLTEELEYSDRDVGVALDGSAGERVDYWLTITNGAGANAADENGTKSYAGRLVLEARGNLHFGANVSVHDYVNGVIADDRYAVAFGGDVELGTYGDRVHLKAGVMAGQNWKALDVAGDPSPLLAAQTFLSYRMPIEGDGPFSAVEPLGRVSWGDPDTDASGVGGWLFTPGIALHMSGRNRLVANVDLWSPATGGTEWSLKMQSFLHF